MVAVPVALIALVSGPVVLRDDDGSRNIAATDQPTTTVEETTTTTAVEVAPTTVVEAPTTTAARTTTTAVPLPPVDFRPDPTKPPRAALRSHAGEVEAAGGSNCWSQPPAPDGTVASVCVDVDGQPYSDAVLPVRNGERVTLRYATDEQPRELFVVVKDSDEGDGVAIPVDRANPTTFVINLPPGPHRLQFSANWAQGDSNHGVKISVSR